MVSGVCYVFIVHQCDCTEQGSTVTLVAEYLRHCKVLKDIEIRFKCQNYLPNLCCTLVRCFRFVEKGPSYYVTTHMTPLKASGGMGAMYHVIVWFYISPA